MPSIDDVVDLDLDSPAPDEREVRVHQVLAMPPDYHLRAPADGTNPVDQDGVSNPYALPTIEESAELLAQEATEAGDGAEETVVANAETDGQGGPANLDPDSQTQTSEQEEWPYGINPNHPDGTPKSQNEINEEMRQRRIEQERAEDPNYGTIFNIGSLWE